MQHELNCHACVVTDVNTQDSDCRRCYYSQAPAVNDRFFNEAVRPYCWFAAVMLFSSYVIGLWFTLRTHAAVIWNTEIDEKKPIPVHGPNGNIAHTPGNGQHVGRKQRSASSTGSIGRNAIKDTQLYKRILGQSLNQVGLPAPGAEELRHQSAAAEGAQAPDSMPYRVPPKTHGAENSTADSASATNVQIDGLSEEQIRQVAEMAATAAAVAARDATRDPKRTQAASQVNVLHGHRVPSRAGTIRGDNDENAVAETVAHGASGGHDAPNWSRTKSAIILLGATVLYAIIAEILVNTVDVVLESVDIDEKFLGITLFALVPNTTEFLVCRFTFTPLQYTDYC